MVFSLIILVEFFVVVNELWINEKLPSLYQIINKLMEYYFAPITVGLVFVNLSYYNLELEKIENSAISSLKKDR
ncbi:hypothetical protein BCR21_11175 [Enterococcus ureasiticus]|uniref:Uncharacterized protein n=1 Tax=Enterococcus ureasiticus TaxID=903984 RepID=A0A1E5GDW4_9ENTE|nr:hypothetical protein BCR21_11175 [Enterococcus ureasiticus]